MCYCGEIEPFPLTPTLLYNCCLHVWGSPVPVWVPIWWWWWWWWWYFHLVAQVWGGQSVIRHSARVRVATISCPGKHKTLGSGWTRTARELGGVFWSVGGTVGTTPVVTGNIVIYSQFHQLIIRPTASTGWTKLFWIKLAFYEANNYLQSVQHWLTPVPDIS